MIREENIPDIRYFREYRSKLGFNNQFDAKEFFGAKNIIPNIDFDYIKTLNERLYEIVGKINSVISDKIKIDNISSFEKENIDHPFKIMKESNILSSLNNQGRRPEQVYFSWMRGFVISNIFIKAVGVIFEVSTKNIKLIGDDNFKDPESFKRSPRADIEITIEKNEKIRIEMQSGFTGINDIKQHKVLEAKRVFEEFGIHTIAIHFDLYNGQVAFIRLDSIKHNDMNWITRQQMEGQTVFNIEQSFFIWKIIDEPIKYKDIEF
ncbi:MAG TPA: restriction endonuclease [Candidatus Paceibacterota bacterium]